VARYLLAYGLLLLGLILLALILGVVVAMAMWWIDTRP
jgi:hypothetical protein